MKCIKCKSEFDGNFCPSCGANHTSVSTQSSQLKKKSKKKRNIVFISIAIVAFLIIGTIVGITKNNNIEKVKAYIDDGKYIEAQEILDKFIDSNTTDERIYIIYSDLHIAQQEYLEALDILETGKNKCSSTERIQEKIDSINTTYSSEIETLKADKEAEQKRIQDEQAAAQAIADANEAEKKRLEDEAKQKQNQLDRDEYIANCKTIAYAELARNPDNYKGQSFVFTGEVIQVLEPTLGNTVTLRINVTKDDNEYFPFYTDTVYCEVILPDGSDRILENDIIEFYGDCDGLYSYNSLLGSKVSIPKISIKYFKIAK